MKRVDFRRKREGRTNYRKRLALLSSYEKRIIARIGKKSIIAQIVEYSPAGDKVVLSAHPKELRALGWKFSTANTPAAYLMGYLLATKAKKNKIERAIFDIGLKHAISKSKIFAFLKGAVDAGLDVPHGAEAFPDDSRITGKHIEEFAKAKSSGSKSQFGEYAKVGADPQSISKVFADVKAKIK